MTEHERKSFDEALNRAKSAEWERRLADRLHHKLTKMTWKQRWSLLSDLEKQIDQ